MVLTTNSPAAGGVIAGVGTISWVVGAFVMAHANKEIRYYESRKVELSFNLEKIDYYHNHNFFNKYIPAITLSFKL